VATGATLVLDLLLRLRPIDDAQGAARWRVIRMAGALLVWSRWRTRSAHRRG
jgi:hypothetical protein